MRKAVTNKGALNPACERSEQTGRESPRSRRRVPQGCDAEAAHNGTTRFLWGGAATSTAVGGVQIGFLR